MSNQQSSFLFIPDINGFTEFVHRTEIEHSQHIISELLENILDSNQIGMELSEIEGDAVLFYKYQDVPSMEEIIEQTKQMFLNFHNHLKSYEKQRICNCGACSSAPNLKLKFIAHQGEIGFIKVKDIQKPHGYDVVLIHKLLKNKVEKSEYLLVTDNFPDVPSTDKLGENLNWVQLIKGKSNYDKIGEVSYNYIPLKPLYQFVKAPVIEPVKKIGNPIIMEIYIDKPTEFVFQYLIRLDLRSNWNKDLKDIKFEEGRINQVGDKHLCVLGSGTLEIQTISGGVQDDKLVYGEEVLNPPFIFRLLSTYYILQKEGNGTRVVLEIHYKSLPIIGNLLGGLFRKSLSKNIGKALDYLKEGAENFEGDLVVSV